MAVPARMVLLSTDWVYPGNTEMASERDPAPGFAAYGRSKAAAEVEVQRHLPDNHLVLRSALIFGPPSPWQPQLRSCLGWLVEAFVHQTAITVFEDEYRTPVSVHALCAAIVAVLDLPLATTWRQTLAARDSTVTGTTPLVVNVGGHDRLSRLGMAQGLFAILRKASGVPAEETNVHATSLKAKGLGTQRPADVSLRTERLQLWLHQTARSYRDELAGMAAQLMVSRSEANPK